MEMREYKVLENDMDMSALKSLFCEASFREPILKVVANPEHMMSYEEWQTGRTGEISYRMVMPFPNFNRIAASSIYRRGRPSMTAAKQKAWPTS